MKKLILLLPLALAACADPELQAHLEAERDFAIQQYNSGPIEKQYDPEYIDDCLYYEDLVCEFEVNE